MATNNRSKLIRRPKTDNAHRSRLISAVDMAFDLKAPTMPEDAQYIFNAILQTPTVVLKNDTVDMEFEIPFDDDLKAGLILPDGRKGPAYLVTSNFNRVMIWSQMKRHLPYIIFLMIR